MIAFVAGRVASLSSDGAVVEVGGIGLTVQCTPGTLAGLQLGEQAKLPTALIVREDSLTLYGFASEDERVVFELLQTASGVGPRLAQAMLATHPPDALRRAVAAEDLGALMLVSGVGRKGAQRIVLELKDRIGAPTGHAVLGERPSTTGDDGWRDTVRGGLLGLGWSAREADAALDAVAPLAAEAVSTGEPASTADLLRAALRSLSRA